jgi:hypothetical protein
MKIISSWQKKCCLSSQKKKNRAWGTIPSGTYHDTELAIYDYQFACRLGNIMKRRINVDLDILLTFPIVIQETELHKMNKQGI